MARGFPKWVVPKLHLQASWKIVDTKTLFFLFIKFCTSMMIYFFLAARKETQGQKN